jgi:uncharacterized membrane protein
MLAAAMDQLPTNSDAPTGAARTDQDKLMLVLSYLGVLALIPYLVSKDADVRWHAKQGLTLAAAFIALNLLTRLLGFLPLIGTMLSWLYWPVVSIGGFCLIVVCIIKALQGERWRIPVIADLNDKW